MAILRVLVAAAIAVATMSHAAMAAKAHSKKRKPAPVERLMPAPVAANWSGFYVGGNVGYGWLNDRGGTNCINPAGLLNAGFCQNIPPTSLDAKNGMIGGQIGYNHQIGQWVMGPELDLQSARLKGSAFVNGPFPFFGGGTLPGTFTAAQQMQWFGTVRGRLGYSPWDRTLVYVTGGLAAARFHRSFAIDNFGNGSLATGDSTTRTGWTVGGGIEVAVTGNWSAKLEGLYYDLGKDTLYAPITSGYVYSREFEYTGGLVRLGVNYRM